MTRRRKGLTLIELLAAVMILSAVAAAGVRLTTESRAAVHSVNLRLDAITALERWRAESKNLGDPEEWRWTDGAGRHWRIRTFDAAPLPIDQALSIPIRWREIEVIADSGGAAPTVLTFQTIASVPEELPEPSTGASGERP